MSIFGFLGKKDKPRHILTDDDRDKAAEYNSTKWEYKRQQLDRENEIQRLRAEREKARLEADIKDFKKTYFDDDDGGQDAELAPLLALLTSAASNSTAAGASSPPLSSPAAPVLSLTDDEIDGLMASIPKNYLVMARKMPAEALRKLIEQKLGKIDDETFARVNNKLRA